MKNRKVKKLIAGLSSMLIAASALPVGSLSAIAAAADSVVYGDTNCDGEVNLADAVLIMQFLANPQKYNITEEGLNNADVHERGDGVTPNDAFVIQRYVLGIINELPESWKEQPPVTDATYIHLKGASIEVEGDHAEVNGNVVTIDHSGVFYIDGTLDDGQICVNVPDETADPETVKLFLNGVNITGRSAPAIYIANAENTSVNLVDGTTNTISDGDTAYTGDWLGAAVIEAKDDITFKGGTEGTGILELNANTQTGIICNNDIKFTGGKVIVTTLNATDKTDAIKGKTSVTVKETAVLSIDAEGDGIKSSKGSTAIEGGSVTIKAGNDAIQAETTIDISGGTVTAGGDRGLTAVGGVNITGGDVVVTSTDNQVDQTLLNASQVTMLFNCIDCPDNTDLMWKKANSFLFELNGIECNFTKKFKYVLVSSLNFTQGAHLNIKNIGTQSYIVHGADNSNEFVSTGNVTVFEDVNPGYMPGPVPSNGYSVTLSGSTISSNAPESAASVSNGELTISEPGIFEVTGSASDVRIVVDVDKTAYPDGVVELDLAGAEITNSTAAPIYVKAIGDEVQIVAKKGTVNTISDGTSHTDTYTNSEGTVNTIDAAIYSHDDLKLKGTGTLIINGNTADGVVSKNDLKIYNGNITVNAADDGIRGKDSITVGNANDTDFSTLKLTVNSKAGDGIKSTATDTATADKSYGIVTVNGGTVDINSYSDGIQGEQDVIINGGDITIYTFEGSGYTGSGSSSGNQNPWGGGFNPGGGMGMDGNPNKVEVSAKGIKAVGLYDDAGTTWQSGGNIAMNGGNIIVDSSDDCIHCGGNIVVKGGNMKLATADDALHSDHDLTLGTSGGAAGDFGIYVTKCYEGVEGENIYQYSGTVIVNADDDGYNAAGGADGSGNNTPGGWNPGGGFGSAGNNKIEIAGGIAIVQSASGDHDAFDSNGSLSITGGVVIANGQEPLDSDGSNTATGGTVITASSQSSGAVAAGTQFTLADDSGNVIVSFKTMRAMGSVSKKYSDGAVNAYIGGTITGGTDLITLDSDQTVYANGTITGGTSVSIGSSTGGGGTFPWG